MKKGIILSVLLVVILVFLCHSFWKKKEEVKEIYVNKYNENFIIPEDFRNEETLVNKVSIKNTEEFDVAIRLSFEEKVLDEKGEVILKDEVIEKKIYDENWKKLNEDSNYYYYSYGIAPGEKIELNQYLELDNREFDKKYEVITNIEIVQYDSYIGLWEISRDTIAASKSHDEKKKFDEEMKIKEEESLLNDKIDKILDSLTLDEKIGQMMIISLNKNNERIKKDKKNYNVDELLDAVKPGGVIIETRDFKSMDMDSMISFTKKVKDSSDIPIFISVDQEGGRVQRFRFLQDRESSGITYIPPMSVIGKTNDTGMAFDVGRLLGMELNVLGFNMNFAPVVDTLYIDSNVIGDRSFGNNPELVSKMGLSLARGLEDRGIIPVYKHFPNHGSTSEDSHDGLPEINKTKEQLINEDLYPFKEAIKNNAPIIMVGHLYYPEITDAPSSLSKEIINDLLKDELGFDGLVITDSLRMDAIINKYGEKMVYEMAINAGVDILLMPNNPDYTVQYIKQSIEEGKITEEQINNSVRKILKFKYTSLKVSEGDKSILDSSLYKELSEKVANLTK